MAKLTADQRRDLMEVIHDRHQRRSTLLATQIPVDRWHEPTYADSILDRLVHNAYRIELRGSSMRQRRAPLSTGSAEENPNKDNDLTEDIPDIHAISGRINNKKGITR